MHPQIRQDHPGNCPICGMALEPLEPSLEEGPNSELIDMNRRFWVSAVLSIPLIVLTLGAELTGWEPLPMRRSIWLQLALATPVVLWGGWPFFDRFWASLKSRNLNMFTLIGLGVGVAYGYSIVATLAPTIFPDSLKTMGGLVPVYFEAAAVITALVLLGHPQGVVGGLFGGALADQPQLATVHDRRGIPEDLGEKREHFDPGQLRFRKPELLLIRRRFSAAADRFG